MMQQTIQAPHHHHDSDFIDSMISHLPSDFIEPVAKKYASIYGSGDYNGENRRKANQYLYGLNENREAGSTRILLQDRETIRKKAERVAMAANKRIQSGGYPSALQLLSTYQISEPSANTQDSKAARLCCPDWWARQFTKQSERESEHFAIKSGFVCRGVSAYISVALLKHIEAKRKASIEAMERMEAVNTDTGETLEMVDVLKGSLANPKTREADLMVRSRGFTDYAADHGHVNLMYTLTAPSKYHRFTSYKRNGKEYFRKNPKYQGFTPSETQKYLSGVWARFRAEAKRKGLNFYGIRTCEPHHDGTPHWHMGLFMNPDNKDQVTEIFRKHALKEDGDERGAAKRRFDVKELDPEKGDFAGYILKYILKNISGEGIGEDYESGLDGLASCNRTRSWASLWGIRQFQQIGGAPVGVWRELRRVSKCPDGLLDEAMKAADSGDWMQYLILQGGADADRKDQPIRCYTVERVNTETGEPVLNKYGESVETVKGVVELLDSGKIETRVHEWIIQRKPDQADTPEQSGFEKLVSTASPIAFDLHGAAARSSLNKCTQGCEVSA